MYQLVRKLVPLLIAAEVTNKRALDLVLVGMGSHPPTVEEEPIVGGPESAQEPLVRERLGRGKMKAEEAGPTHAVAAEGVMPARYLSAKNTLNSHLAQGHRGPVITAHSVAGRNDVVGAIRPVRAC